MNDFRRTTERYFYLSAPLVNAGHDGRSKHDTFKSTKVFPVGTQVKVVESVAYEAATGFDYGPVDRTYSILGRDVGIEGVSAQDHGRNEPARSLDDACGRIRFSPSPDTVCELAVRKLIAEGKLSIADVVSAFDRSEW